MAQARVAQTAILKIERLESVPEAKCTCSGTRVAQVSLKRQGLGSVPAVLKTTDQ